MKTMAHLGLMILAVCGSAYAEDIGKAMSPVAADVPPWVERTIPGGKDLAYIFDWFNRIDLIGESELHFQLRRANEKSIRMDVKTGSRAWEYISPAKAVVIKPGEQRHIWIEGVGILIGVDKEIFPVEGCPWLSNAVHKIYVRWSQAHMFNRTTDEDKYVISPDLRKAFYLEGGKDVEYPLPFVNAKPNLSAEELEGQEMIKGLREIISEDKAILHKAMGTIVPNKRYDVKLSGEGGVLYAVFGDDGRTLLCAEYSPKSRDDGAEAILFRHSPAEQRDCVIWLNADGSLETCEVIEGGTYHEHEDDAFKLAFAREVLSRLNLTAADLPGIKLGGILATPEAK